MRHPELNNLRCGARIWHRWFAWRPVLTRGGSWVWLRYVERAWDERLNPWAYMEHSGYDGGWTYRHPLAQMSASTEQGKHA